MILRKDFLNSLQGLAGPILQIFVIRLQLLRRENKEIVFRMLIFRRPLKELSLVILKKDHQQLKQKKELLIMKLAMRFAVGI
jgi:hypothetical protein